MQDFWERKVHKTEDELARWNAKYERDIEMSKRQLEELTAQRETLLAELGEVEREYTAEDDAKRKREEHERLRKAVEAKERKAAILIQCVYRGFQARQYVAELKNPGGKKKKGKKKKKKGK
eukprot:TRINITY_DN26986_c0_g1_i1.p3 TRINITY_DN26986_c0_g1~~TRINITY_DN26986_c0_g1_i1.p3  ORF type:complete len:142 (+),score=79.19 TRINITY_DN26986_c0_g1_i1:66-428(+)